MFCRLRVGRQSFTQINKGFTIQNQKQITYFYFNYIISKPQNYFKSTFTTLRQNEFAIKNIEKANLTRVNILKIHIKIYNLF